jgi:mono/diheme cytochrome c family protein
MMMKRAQAAIVGMMLVVAGCGGDPAPVAVAPSSVAPSTSPTAVVSASPVAAATATPAAATVQPAASSTPQPSAAATAKPTAAAATPAVKEAATAKPAPTATPAPPSAAPSPSAKPADEDGAAQAQVLYKDNCMSCHGAGLAGDFGPNLTKVGSHKTKDEIIAQIMGGKGDMPPFKSALKSEEIEVLAAWLADKK